PANPPLFPYTTLFRSNIDLTWNAPFRGLGGTTVLIPQPYGLANVYNRRTPYSIQYLLNVQRELGGDTALEIGYLGSVSRRLESLDRKSTRLNSSHEWI